MDRSAWWVSRSTGHSTWIVIGSRQESLTQRNDALGYEARPTDAKTDTHSEPHETGSEPRKKPAGQQVAGAERYRHRTARMLIDLLG